MTIAICTRNRRVWLERVLADILPQLDGRDSVLVIDQSDLNRRADLSAYARVRHVLAEPEGLPAARNVAIHMVETELICFLDDDVRVWPDALAKLRVVFADPRVAGASARIEERRGSLNAAVTRCEIGWDGRVRVRLTGSRTCELATLKGACMAYRTAVLREVGPSDRGFSGTALLEDADLSSRVRQAGGRLLYVPDALVVHLSAPADGCRARDPFEAERSRLHNTARFLRIHRPFARWIAWPTQAALAVRGGLRARSLPAMLRLLYATVER